MSDESSAAPPSAVTPNSHSVIPALPVSSSSSSVKDKWKKDVRDTSKDGAEEHKDAAVQQTSDDAAVSKLSALSLGYISDEFLGYFIPLAARSRRPPLINRGYFARSCAMSQIMKSFAQLAQTTQNQQNQVKIQVLSLGAGSDTTYFRLKKEKKHIFKYYEVDFLDAMKRKYDTIMNTPELLQVTKSVNPDFSSSSSSAASTSTSTSTSLPSFESPLFSFPHCEDYYLAGVDMRDLVSLEQSLIRLGIDFSIPTLLLAECVLVYLPPQHSTALIDWCSSRFFGGSVFVSYEQIHPFDAFGRTMMQNLDNRGCSLLSLQAYPDLLSQEKRFVQTCHYDYYKGWDMNDVYNFYLSKEETKRIEKLELFDEFEEWHLIQAHYHISLAYRKPFIPQTHPTFDSNTHASIVEQRAQEVDLSKVGFLAMDKIPFSSSTSSMRASASLQPTAKPVGVSVGVDGMPMDLRANETTPEYTRISDTMHPAKGKLMKREPPK